MLGKKSPNLRLISSEGQGGSGGGDRPTPPFRIVALDELNQSEQDKIRRIVAEVAPGAAILGIALSPRSWDLRPVVKLPNEDLPSVVRFLGPEVTLSLGISARMQDLFERITRHTSSGSRRELSSGILDWGVLEGQLWYRREQVERTLADILEDTTPFSISDVISTAKGIVAQIGVWHGLGLIHGHITPSNVVCDSSGKITFLDAGVGISVVQAAKWLNAELFPLGYEQESFAPEALTGETTIIATDIFGVGQLFRRMFQAMERQYREMSAKGPEGETRKDNTTVISTLLPLVERMTAASPKARPSLSEVIRALDESLPTYRVAVKSPDTLSKGQSSKGPNSKDTVSRREDRPLRESGSGEVQRREPLVRQSSSAPARGRMISVHPGSDDLRSRESAPTHDPIFEEDHSVSHTVPSDATSNAVRTPEPRNESRYDYERHPVKPTPRVRESVPAPVEQRPSHAQRESIPNRAIRTPGSVSHPSAGHGAGHIVAGGPLPSQAFTPVTPFHQTPPVAPPAPQVPAVQDSTERGTQLNLEEEFEIGSTSASELVRSPSSSSYLLLYTVLFILVGVLGYEFFPWRQYLNWTPNYTSSELKAQWDSRRPSQMKIVAEVAIRDGAAGQFAENIIVEDARNGEILNSGINASLIRIAFDQKWERELSAQDRHVALALALSGILDQDVVEEELNHLPALDALHPGVLLAITATAGPHVARELSAVPAEMLTKLPDPFRQAFRVLLQDDTLLTCGDAAVRFLAQAGTMGINGGVVSGRPSPNQIDVEGIAAFLSQKTTSRLQALAFLFAGDALQSGKLLDILLNRTDVSLPFDSVTWARKVKLREWNEVEPIDQLFVVAGVPPLLTQRRAIEPKNLLYLLAHPVPKLRSFAVSQLLALAKNGPLRFKHPGATIVLAEVERAPEMFTPDQTLQLFKFLAKPEEVKADEVLKWLTASNPPVALVEAMLVSVIGQPTSTSVDVAVSKYLREKNWKPDVEMLKKLCRHPDSTTRLFAYGRIFEIPDTKLKISILKEALGKETNPDYQANLQAMINGLEAADTVTRFK